MIIQLTEEIRNPKAIKIHKILPGSPIWEEMDRRAAEAQIRRQAQHEETIRQLNVEIDRIEKIDRILDMVFVFPWLHKKLTDWSNVIVDKILRRIR